MSAETVLWRAGGFFAALGLVCLAGTFVDAREVGGVNTWLKPLKFCLSASAYLLTLALLLPYLAAPEGRRLGLAWGSALLLGGATALIVLQGARGVQSHFNTRTPLDGAIFSAMGMLIGGNTLVLLWLLGEFFVHATPMPAAFRWGIRLGLLSGIIGSLQGVAMIRRMAHTVGAPDGGPGLPFLNFSTMAGDLRIAHALALHGMQLLPLLGWWLAKAEVPRGALLVWLCFLAQLALTAVTWLQALSGKPLLALARTFRPTSL